MTTPKPVVLTILDGWGLRDDAEFNAPKLARTPTMDRLYETCPNATLVTFGPDVGLPTGQMGNSEVGHNILGAGRTFDQGASLVEEALSTGRLFGTETWDWVVGSAATSEQTFHLVGLLSDQS